MADFPPVASLRSFEAVARLGSVTQAAHEMSVTHSAVSQHIKQLEALVGVSLFVRHGRGVRITERGGSMPCKSARRYSSTSPTPRGWCRSNPAPWN